MTEPAMAPRNAPPDQAVTGLILAGGLGRRMSADGRGTDKGLQPLRGRPMVEHVIERLRPQVDALLISANRNLERWRAFGYPVLPDEIGGFAGPLAGLHAGLRATATRWLVTAPCDSPFLPVDLVERLAAAIRAEGVRVAVARTGTQVHPVFMMVERAALAGLEAFLAEGHRKAEAWYATQPFAEVDFGDEAAFINLNTPEELRSADA